MLFRNSNKGVEENATYVPNDAVALFNSMLDNAETANWYAGTGSGRVLDSSASCSSTPASVFNNFDNHQVSNYFMPQNPIPNNPFELGFENWQFDTGLDNEIRALNEFGGQTEMGNFNLSPNSSEFAVQLSQGRLEIGELGFGEVSIPPPLLINRSKLLNNVSQPTLFQKRAALKKNIENINGSNLVHFIEGNDVKNEEIGARKRKSNLEDDPDYGNDDDLEGQVLRTGGGNLNMEESGKNGESSSPGNSTVTGDGGKGKKKAHPAKNLLAERRRRKKLNDRLYMLRSVVPKISKMDRASILGDAIEYLKELTQKINDLHTELDSSPSSSTITSSSCFQPVTSKAFGLPVRIKEELSPRTCSSFQSTATGQPARIEVRLKDDRAVSIHMFCSLRPGILSSTVRTMEALGLDIEHATISCFNGFTLDVFQAEKCKESEELNPEEIKAALLDSAGCHGII